MATAGRSDFGRGAWTIRPVATLVAVTAATGAAQAASAATRSALLGSWWWAYQVQNAASARASA